MVIEEDDVEVEDGVDESDAVAVVDGDIVGDIVGVGTLTAVV